MAGLRSRTTQPQAQKLLGKVPWWWAGLSKYEMASAQKSQNQTLKNASFSLVNSILFMRCKANGVGMWFWDWVLQY